MEQPKPSVPSPEVGRHNNQPPAIEGDRNVQSQSQERLAPSEAVQQVPVQGPTLPVPQALSAAPRITPPAAVNPVKDDNPLVAADEDVIEREWVDRAKKIVAQTKNDPRQQELEVSKLQADYLKKRYGKEIKLVSE